jgi:uncharacterized membrane protein YkgB
MSSLERPETGDGQSAPHEVLPSLPGSNLPGIPEPEERRLADADGSALRVSGQPAVAALGLAGPDTVVATRRAAALADRGLEHLRRIEPRAIDLATRWFEWAARIAIFIIYFWFGLLKLINLSPATPLATALVQRTIGMQYFNDSFKALAFFECALALLFLIPSLTWVCSILLIIHMGIVSSPLVIAPSVAWTHPGVPTLEGQYIIKDLALIALTIGILACRRSPGRRLRAAALAPGNEPADG